MDIHLIRENVLLGGTGSKRKVQCVTWTLYVCCNDRGEKKSNTFITSLLDCKRSEETGELISSQDINSYN